GVHLLLKFCLRGEELSAVLTLRRCHRLQQALQRYGGGQGKPVFSGGDGRPPVAVRREFDSVRGRKTILELFFAVAAPLDAKQTRGLWQFDLRPAPAFLVADPAMRVPPLTVVQVVNLVDGEAWQQGGGCRLRAVGSQRVVFLAVGAVELNLVQAGFL